MKSWRLSRGFWNRRGVSGWMSLEILLAVALCVALTSAGVVTMYQIMGMSGGLYPKSQLENVALSRLLLEIQRDFYSADRAYVWNSKIEEQVSGVWGPLQSNTHPVSVYSNAGANGEDYNIWNVAVSDTNDGSATTAGSFLYYWTNNATSTTIRSTASDSTHKYYTIVLLKGYSQINGVVYLTCTEAGGGVTYTLTRYENGGAKLWQGSSFTYSAPGVDFTHSDQSVTTTIFPYFQRNGNGIDLRLPTAFSYALKDIGTGQQARRVKKSADDWGVWTFIPRDGTRWD